MEKITADDVLTLVCSPKLRPIMVRTFDGSIEIRSDVSTDEADDGHELIISLEDLPNIDDSGLNFANLTPDDLNGLAAQLNAGMADHG